jgi:hypothetical protein
MAKAPRTCDRLLMVLVNRKGAVTEADIASEMQYDSMYRISTEFWRLKKRGAVIKTIRDGRKVSGYELVNVDEMKTYLSSKGFTSFVPAKAQKTAPATVAAAKPAKTAKAPAKSKVKAEKPAKVAVNPTAQVELGVAPVVDILDDIDTSITDFEDREFAQGFAEGKM